MTEALAKLAANRFDLVIAALDLPKSSVHGLCNTLLSFGYLRRADCDQLQGFLFSGPKPLAEMKQWLHGLPPAQRTSGEARLLDRLCEAPGQALAWNAPAIDHALRGSVPASKAEIEQLHRECLKLLDRHPARGLWTVHLTTGSQPGDLPGIRLAPGGMMLGYLRELRCTPEGQRPG